jgi:4'-phosphopantetheinyl transferase
MRHAPAPTEWPHFRCIDVWAVRLDGTPEALLTLGGLLSPDEQCRAGRFRLERDRWAFTTARGVLRLLLSRYSGLPAASIDLAYAPGGKPRLSDAAVGGGIQFNVSHTDGLAIYAFARGRPVGVDVERIRPVRQAEDIASRYFTARERSCLLGGPEESLTERFLTLWTAKESFVKASGHGLSIPLASFDCADLLERATLDAKAADGTHWQVHRLPRWGDYVSSVTTASGHHGGWRCFRTNVDQVLEHGRQTDVDRPQAGSSVDRLPSVTRTV